MIPNNTKRGEVTNHLGNGRKAKLQVDPEAMQHIMGLLTNIYSDPELAVLREYSTNAWDAQIVAGVKSPIRVSTPTNLAPVLKIKDQGVGLSEDDLLEMYSFYGASTKRADENQNGFMGIGSKSALAYGDQFTIVSVKDGIKVSVSVSRTADETAELEIIDSEPTDEPNGTEILIPSKRYHDFDEKAQELFKFWAPGTVLINGAEPKRDDLEKMTDRIYFHDGDDDYIVMGNIAYPLGREKGIISHGRHVAVFVTMNGDDEVVVHPSRERLIYNGITENVILGIREEFNSKIKEFIDAEVKNAKNFVEAFRLIRKFESDYGKKFTSGLTYKDMDFSDKNFVQTVDGREMGYHYISWMPRRDRNAVTTYNNMSMEHLIGAKMIVVGYPNTGVASAHKARMRSYMTAHEIQHEDYWANVVLYSGDALPEPTKTSGFEVHQWKTILAETKNVINYNRGGTGFSYGGRYDVFDSKTGQWSVEAVDSQAEILFYSEKEQSLTNGLRDRILKDNPDIIFIKAPTNRHTKLEREYPNAKPFNAYEFTKKFAKIDFDALTESDKAVIKAKTSHRDHHGYEGYRWVNVEYGIDDVPKAMVDQIDDPEYRAAATLYNSPMPVVGLASADERYHKLDAEAKKERNDVIQFTKRYPLMNWEKHPKDTLEYVNAMYAKNKEN